MYYISGGMRSGKSSHGSQLALSLSENPIYVATARRWDEEFDQRIKIHESDRDERWELVEVEKYLSKEIKLKDQVILVDCLTLWLTNFFMDNEYDVSYCLEVIKKEIFALKEQTKDLIIISNEIGMGLHAETSSGRKFTDLQGWANQYAANLADQAILMVSGLPIVLK